MALTKTIIGTRDGRALAHYAGEHVLITGKVEGTVTLTDGTVVDVSPYVIEVPSPEVAGEISHHIAVRMEAEGHPDHAPSEGDPNPEPYIHLCTESCGPAKRADDHFVQALALGNAQVRTDAIGDGATRDAFAAALGTSSATSMARASTAAENAALNGLDGTGATNVIPDVSLHTGDPGTTGASENANTGSYARLACSWNAAASGAKTNSSTLTFTTGGSVAVSFIGTWSSATYGAGNYAIGGALSSAVTAVTITVAASAISIAAS